MSDPQTCKLDLPFKGSRTYLRFADIFPALIELAREHVGLQAQMESLTIRKPFTHVIQVMFEQPPSFSATCVRLPPPARQAGLWR